MSEVSAPPLQERPQPRRSQSGMFIGGFAAVCVLMLAMWSMAGQGTVNPNVATRDQLMSLPEMSPELADSILKLRPFTDEADFGKRVAGLSPDTLAKIRMRLDFDGDGRGDCCVH